VRNAEAEGSIPFSSTKIKQSWSLLTGFFYFHEKGIEPIGSLVAVWTGDKNSELKELGEKLSTSEE
ncbi:MAG TPA: hypothetical protein VIX18_09395, partial [Nitrospirota bacterium]